jgi:hypothetical protein
MKLLTAYYFSLLLLACAVAGNANATRYENDDQSCCKSSCFSSCYECGCNPLYCGAWDIQVQAGVDPIIWRNRGPFLVNVINNIEVGCTVSTAFDSVPKFSTFFKTPWTVGGQIGHHWSDNTRVYVEFNYIQAKSKNPILTALNSVVLNFDVQKYRLFDGYVGARYYWDRWCDRVSFFLGGKIGFTHHRKSTFNFRSPDGVVTVNQLNDNTPLFTSHTIVSGGADFGLDICFCGNWSFVITGAVIAACGPRTNFNIVPAQIVITDERISNLFSGGIGTELRFPVTAGIRYSF